jgi:hypothetical protein
LRSKRKTIKRKNEEPPYAIEKWGWRYHHIGIPSTVPREGEFHLPQFGVHVCGFETSPFGIEWMRYDPDSPIDELIKKVPHIAFEVDDIDLELRKHRFKILTSPNSPGDGIKVAMIEHNGAPIELIEFKKKKS